MKPFCLDQGGCTCPSCSATNYFMYRGFADWPRGNPAGRKSGIDYVMHVSYGKRVPLRMTLPSLEVTSFYACAASSKAEIRAVLAQTFGVSV